MTHQPRKRFGQNFLHDDRVIRDILDFANPQPGEHWVEIGPGLGALTGPLLAHGVRLDVVELDRDLVAHLQKRYADNASIRIHGADALQFDFGLLAETGEKLRLIGNLPYNISTPLMFHLLETTRCIEDMHVMLQKEVVNRICAAPGSKQYGRLSVMMQYHCEAEWLFDVPPDSFDPPPKVMSSILRLTPHAQPPVELRDFNHFSQLVTQAFSQRRKTLRNALRDFLTADDFETLAIDANLRAESVSLEMYARMANLGSGP
ncbi:MAG: 16S rRNA (adenine(1518)-N(6)/adenine(1519)-N(6))-dimethyltransferase RsmA [Methylomonas sp.]|nr:16S rRNA (adenine(1518)-N(6)/adenine(1519)-N(6))-dimethyltransferase RsmA [Methylomonas sp.]PPD21667.1 MAG: 16S rRNA (adenine(1518)-N(6)/adenine(1519)-N(6))-dimethyltransferase [Methylomonas sp.]PPD25952.1 MAG: 16S rRNA (adenine(1518)-N(6)/adenine(1519)-N(6))-dimethyltransferase [Methylomonas sp.]PPD37688.1 MAG: 16S rRNA (adenine(1518)-N(6)/adenine(1519)-N(6))-dimethyltransferase [Methylomonas sp.]PPD39295.1 MAG: 16S rRNA (adenine(1518)-N(6)/adenine(1519)-N(6))-dimethyltransferase [Methylomo